MIADRGKLGQAGRAGQAGGYNAAMGRSPRPAEPDLASTSGSRSPLGSRVVIYEPARSPESPEVRRAVDVATRIGISAEDVRIESSSEDLNQDPSTELAILIDRSPKDLLRASRATRAVWMLARSRRPRERLLVAVDSSKESGRREIDRRAVEIAKDLCRVLDLELHGFTVWEAPRFPGYILRSQVRAGVTAFSRLAQRRSKRIAREFGIPGHRWHLREGPFEKALASLASEIDPYAVVVGTLGREGLSRLLLGSRVEKVVESSPDYHVVAVRS